MMNYIAERSGSHGIDRIEGFEEWHGNKFSGLESASLKPIRMVLVGLGVDERTSRMTRFLANQGVEISLLMFLGYNHNGSTLLARQVQVEAEADRRRKLDREEGWAGESAGTARQPRPGHAEQWEDTEELWNSVLDMLRENLRGLTETPGAGASEWSKHQLRFRSSSDTGP